MPDPLAKSFYRRFREARLGWVRRLAPLVFASAVVLALGGSSAYLLTRFYNGVSHYRSPLAKYPPAGEATDPLVPQVVLVVVDGLRDDIAHEMPTLQRLRAQGASATVIVPFADSRPAWTTLMTGAEAESNDAPLIATDLVRTQFIAPESLFVTARRSSLDVALAAHEAWQPLIAPQFLNETYFVGTEETDAAVADRRVNDAAIGFINNFSPNFVLVHLTLPDVMARRYGATSEPYRQAAYHTDQLLAQLSAALNLRQSSLMVTASYGNVDKGGHGGSEDVVTHVPLIAAGARIKSGDYGFVRQSDIAPTIAALIGGSIPSAAQGSILFAMLDMNDVQRANKALALARQQREIGVNYLNAIGGTLSEAALNDPLVAKSSFEVKNYESAFSLANLAAQQVQHDMRTSRLTRIEKERFARAPLTLALLLLPLLLFWLRRSLRLAIGLVMALGIVSAQHFLYLNAGHLYSFSDLASIEAFIRAMFERSALALLFGGLMASILHWRDDKPSRLRVAQTLLLTCALAVYIASIPFALGFFTNGLTLQWYIGDLGWSFMQVFSLTAIFSLTVLAVPVVILVALTYWLALIVVHRLARQRWVAQLTLKLRNIPSAVAQLFLN